MGHSGKHPIDPETGLCDICDRDAIEDIRKGRVPVRRVYRGPENDEFTEELTDEPFYPGDENDFVYEPYDGETRRYGRRRRIRRIIQEQAYEKPVYVRRRKIPIDYYPDEEIVPRRRAPLVEEVIVRRPVQPKTFYYVDRENARVPRIRSPVTSPRPYYVSRRPANVVRPVESLPPITPPSQRRVVRVVRRPQRTPSPVYTQRYETNPRTRIQSDPELIESEEVLPTNQRFNEKRNEQIREELPIDEIPFEKRQAVMYHIEAGFPDNFDRIDANSERSTDIDRSPLLPQTRRQNDELPKRDKVDPEQQSYPQIIRRSYRPKGNNDYDPPTDSYRRTNGRTNPSNRANYHDEPLTNNNRRSYRNDQVTQDPSVYYIRSSNRP